MPDCFPIYADDFESDFFINLYSSIMIFQNTEFNMLKPQLTECICDEQLRRFSANPLPPGIFIANKQPNVCCFGIPINRFEFDISNMLVCCFHENSQKQ